MLDRFQQSGGVHCYKIIKLISWQVIKSCLGQVAEATKQKNTTTIREAYNLGSGKQFLSCTFFFTKSRPSFWVNGTERNITYCYALMVEIGNYFFVSNSGAPDFSDLLIDYVQLVEANFLLNAFVAKCSDVRKFSAQAINTARVSVRKQSYEGKRLQDWVSTIGAAKHSVMYNWTGRTAPRQ